MKKTMTINQMTCAHCDEVVKKQGLKHNVTIHSLSYTDGLCTLEYANEMDYENFKKAVVDQGYTFSEPKKNNPLISILYLLPLGILFLLSVKGFNIKLLEGASLGAVFAYGLFSSLHCMSMCGGIALSACQLQGPQKILQSDLYYNISRVLSYTLIGGVLGWIGTGFSLSGTFKAGILVFSGLFMILLGLRQLGITLFKLPSFKSHNPFVQLIKKAKHPATVGFLNGFIPCGPLQMAQLFALSAGSFTSGMLVMLVFGLGTFPTMFYIGALNAIFTGKSRRIAFKVSGMVILFMAALTFSRAYTFIELEQSLGYAPTSVTKVDIKTPAPSDNTRPFAPIVDGFQIVHLEADRTYILENVQVKKDIPVRLIINAITLTQCIDTITVPEYGITKGLALGENTIEFTPTKSGELIITCWMNMVTQKLDVE
jgi:sulfite exporter TauE/SafE